MNEEKTSDDLAAEAADRMTGIQEAEIVQPKEEPPKEKSTALAERPSQIVVRDGLIEPRSLTELTRVAKGLLESGCIPKQFETVPQIIMGMQFLRQLGIPDIAGLPRLCIINGSYSIWGEAPKAVCQSEIEDFDEFWFDDDYNRICFENKNLKASVSGALCKAKRKGIPTWVERVFTVDDAKHANLWSKSGPWKLYPTRMLQMRARSWVLKDAFPDKFQGLAIAEYDHNAIIDVGGDVVETKTDVAATLIADRFK